MSVLAVDHAYKVSSVFFGDLQNDPCLLFDEDYNLSHSSPERLHQGFRGLKRIVTGSGNEDLSFRPARRILLSSFVGSSRILK